MSAHLHRIALWLRLFLVCVVLTGVSAPTRTMGYREAVVAIATVTAPAERKAAPAPSAVRVARPEPPAVTSWPAPLAAPAAPTRSLSPPRQLFLINSALLC